MNKQETAGTVAAKLRRINDALNDDVTLDRSTALFELVGTLEHDHQEPRARVLSFRRADGLVLVIGRDTDPETGRVVGRARAVVFAPTTWVGGKVRKGARREVTNLGASLWSLVADTEETHAA